MAEAVGNSKIISLVKKLGIDPAKDNIEDVPVMTLGTGSISPLEMAAAYATFANGGYYRQPIAITEIDSRTGSVLYQHTDNPSQVLTEGEAAAVTDVLSGVMKGSGTGAAGALSVNQPYAGKTGTTDNTTNRHEPGVLRLCPAAGGRPVDRLFRGRDPHPKVRHGPAGRQHQPACL